MGNDSIYEKRTKSSKGIFEIRQDDLFGKLLGSFEISNKENQNKFTLEGCNLEKIDGKKDIFLKFKGTVDSRFELDWFKFSD